MDTNALLNVQLLATQSAQNAGKNIGLVESKDSSSSFETQMSSATEQQRQQESAATNGGSDEERAAEESNSGNDQPQSGDQEDESVTAKQSNGDQAEESETVSDEEDQAVAEEVDETDAELLAALQQGVDQVQQATVVQAELRGTEKTAVGVTATAELATEVAKKNDAKNTAQARGLIDAEVEDKDLKSVKAEQLTELGGKRLQGEKNADGRFSQQLTEQLAESTKQSSESASLTKIGTRLDGNSLNSNLTQLQTDKAQATPELQTKIHTSFHKQDWQQAFNQRFMWMVSQGASKALIQLDPAELGPMEVKMQVAKDSSVNVVFTSHSSSVRDILDSQIPRLRELMEEQGLTLGDVSVGGGDEGNQAEDGEESDAKTDLANEAQGVDQEGEEEAMVVSDRLLDTFV